MWVFIRSLWSLKEVFVRSRKCGEEETYIWHSKGDGSFTIDKSDKKLDSCGTEISLKLKDSELAFLERYKIQHVIKTYSDHISFPIEFSLGEEAPEVLNERSALWTKSSSNITDDQYNEFYRHVSHSPDKPWLRLHNRVEGNLGYTNLLYVPSSKPFDLFHPDRTTRVKLYVKRVFITDSGIRLIPEYMRFIRGVVDSEDLPLNISRETLQDNVIIDKIRRSIVKKIISSLKKKLDSDRPEYDKFWNNFGEVMKRKVFVKVH